MSGLAPWLQGRPLIAILRGVRPDEVLAIAAVLVDAGFRIVEVPLNSPDPEASIRRLADAFGEQVLIGAGTVLDVAGVDRVHGAGGRLVVSPNGDADVVARAKHLDLLTLPGVATPSEAFRMLNAGADGLKLFPAEMMPPPVCAALRAVLPPATLLVPVGAITPDKLSPYLDAGAAGFGLGSALYRAGDSAEAVAGKAQMFRQALSHQGDLP